MRLFVAVFIMVGAAFSQFGEEYVSMKKTGAEKVNYNYARCFYSDYRGAFSISILIQGSRADCPYRINYWPERGTWEPASAF